MLKLLFNAVLIFIAVFVTVQADPDDTTHSTAMESDQMVDQNTNIKKEDESNTLHSSDSAVQTTLNNDSSIVAQDSVNESISSTVVAITSEPVGAAVLWNDSIIGISPVIIPNVIPGEHSLVLKMKGYYLKKATIVIAAKDTQKVHLELLKPSSVYFTSKPTGAKITLNGKPKGTAPFLDSLMKPGEYLLNATVENYDLFEKKIMIENGVNDTVSIVLVPSDTADHGDDSSELESTSTLRKYSGIIGAAAFGIFTIVILIMERNDL